mmetsp:Transcript_6592/g.9963  ORF Transcript_6592/g.9963 Transcript_6592/m.9963 type:complete len:430 (-) Transcript_6592:127-1416(-)
MTKLYEILAAPAGESCPYRTSDSSRTAKAKDHNQLYREIHAKARSKKQNEINEKMEKANEELLHNITTMKPRHSHKEFEKEYEERKKLAEKLRSHNSPTALHLLDKSKCTPGGKLNRPSSAGPSGLFRSFRRSQSQKVYPGGSSMSTRPRSAGYKSSTEPSPYSPFKEEDIRRKLNMSSANACTSPEKVHLGHSFSAPIMQESSDQPVEGKSNDEGDAVEKEKIDPDVSEEAYIADLCSKQRKSLLGEFTMKGLVSNPPTRAKNTAEHSVSFVVRIYDVGLVAKKGSLDARTNKPNTLVPTSLGVLVDSRLQPETEKTISYELFIPMAQIRHISECSESSSANDSLYRKLRRLSCLQRDQRLYMCLATGLSAVGQEQLCSLLLRNIETVITINGPQHGTDDDTGDDAELMKNHISVDIKLKDSALTRNQ